MEKGMVLLMKNNKLLRIQDYRDFYTLTDKVYKKGAQPRKDAHLTHISGNRNV